MPDFLQDTLWMRLKQVADQGFAIICGVNTSAQWAAKTSFDPNWIAAYQEGAFMETDPVLAFSCMGRGAARWETLLRGKLHDRLRESAAAHGLSHGTVYTNIVDGIKCAVSAAHSKAQLDADEIAALQDITTTYALTAPRPRRLPRDAHALRYLFLLANGARSDEIRERLALSPRALTLLKRTALELTGARTLAQAVYRARVNNMI